MSTFCSTFPQALDDDFKHLSTRTRSLPHSTVLREAIAAGLNRIAASDFCGPQVTDQIIGGPCTRIP
jgi:hypothetical protein